MAVAAPERERQHRPVAAPQRLLPLSRAPLVDLDEELLPLLRAPLAEELSLPLLRGGGAADMAEKQHLRQRYGEDVR